MHEIKTLEAGVVTAISTGAVTEARIQHLENYGMYPVQIYATAADSAPNAATSAYIILRSGQGVSGDLTPLFPGVASPFYLWAMAPSGGSVSVSHA